MTDTSVGLAALEQRIDQLSGRIVELEEQLAAAKTQELTPGSTTPEVEDTMTSRRDLLRKGGLGVAAAAAGAAAFAKPAAATDGDPILIGQTTNGTSATLAVVPDAGTGRNGFTFATTGAFGTVSAFPAAGAGYATGPNQMNGMYGYTNTRDNTDSRTGYGLVGATEIGGRSPLLLIGAGKADPRDDTFSHRAGEVLPTDGGSALWYCVEAGTPGTWRKLADADAAGILHALPAPVRAYDSRPAFGGSGPLAAASSEAVSLNVTGVPSGVNAVVVNLAITNAASSGFATIYANGIANPGTSSINYTFGQNIANEVTTAVDASGSAQVYSQFQTDYVVDVIGYYL